MENFKDDVSAMNGRISNRKRRFQSPAANDDDPFEFVPNQQPTSPSKLPGFTSVRPRKKIKTAASASTTVSKSDFENSADSFEMEKSLSSLLNATPVELKSESVDFMLPDKYIKPRDLKRLKIDPKSRKMAADADKDVTSVSWVKTPKMDIVDFKLPNEYFTAERLGKKKGKDDDSAKQQSVQKFFGTYKIPKKTRSSEQSTTSAGLDETQKISEFEKEQKEIVVKRKDEKWKKLELSFVVADQNLDEEAFSPRATSSRGNFQISEKIGNDGEPATENASNAKGTYSKKSLISKSAESSPTKSWFIDRSAFNVPPTRLSQGFWARPPLKRQDTENLFNRSSIKITSPESEINVALKSDSIIDNLPTQPMPGRKGRPAEVLAPDSQTVQDGELEKTKKLDQTDVDSILVVPDSERLQLSMLKNETKNDGGIDATMNFYLKRREDFENLSTLMLSNLEMGNEISVQLRVVCLKEIEIPEGGNADVVTEKKTEADMSTYESFGNAGDESSTLIDQEGDLHAADDTVGRIASGNNTLIDGDIFTYESFKMSNIASPKSIDGEDEDENIVQAIIDKTITDVESIVEQNTDHAQNLEQVAIDQNGLSEPCLEGVISSTPMDECDNSQDVAEEESESICDAFSVSSGHSYSPPGQIVFCCSGFAPTPALVSRFVDMFDAVYAPTYSSYVTHLVLTTQRIKKQYWCDRPTMTYFQGIADRKWLVSSDWIEQSIRLERVVDPAYFEVMGDIHNGFCNAPRMARLSVAPLLEDFSVYLYDFVKDKAQLEALIRNTGGTICDTIEELETNVETKTRICLVLVSLSRSKESDFQSLYDEHKVPIINVEWLFESISGWNVVPHSNYLLCPKKTTADVFID